MKYFRKIVFFLSMLLFVTMLGSCSAGDDGSSDENETTEDTVVCTWVQESDKTNYYVFYSDKTVEGYINGKLEYPRSTLSYEGSPNATGTLTIKTATGAMLFTFTVTKSGSAITATEKSFGTKYSMGGSLGGNSGDSKEKDDNGTESSGGSNPGSSVTAKNMFMGFDNVETISSGTDMTEITTKIYSLTSDTTLKFTGGINSITLTTVAAAMATNDSVKIALDFSETTGITEWTNKLAGVKTLCAISLPKTLDSIQSGAFTDCTNLKAITIPCSIKAYPTLSSDSVIVNFAGTLADWLNSSVLLPSGQGLYLNGEELSGTVTIPSSISVIRCSAFADCSKITSVVIPSTVTSIEEGAFARCRELTSVTMNNGLYSIGSGAFTECVGLTSVTIPATVIDWKYAFSYCTGLTSVSLDGVWSIDEGAFYGCSGLENITIPDSVESIRSKAFYGCNGLLWGTIEIPYRVISIGDYAFSRCNMTSVTISDNVMSIGEGAFCECSNLTSVTIPYTVTEIEIGMYAFKGCVSLGDLTIPASVASIGYGAFTRCTGLKRLTIEDGTSTLELGYNSEYKGLFSDCPLERVYLGRNLSYKTYSSCGYSPFYDIATLVSVEIGSNVIDIGKNAFYECSSLREITIPDSVTTIKENAFFGCSGLDFVYYNGSSSQWESIVFGNSYSNPCYNGADLCINGEYIIPNGVTTIEASAFAGRTGLKIITIPDSVTSISEYAFSGCTGLTSVSIPDTVTAIGHAAFQKCTELKSITIPNSVTSIEDSVFAGSGLTSVIIPNTVTTIGILAFSGCALTSVTIPDSVTSIGWGAFEACALTTIVIPSSVTIIEDEVFAWCQMLKTVTISDNVTTIGNSAFSCCFELRSVTIPASVTSIGNYAFDGCPVNVNYRGTEEQWNSINFGNDVFGDYGFVPTIVYNYTGD